EPRLDRDAAGKPCRELLQRLDVATLALSQEDVLGIGGADGPPVDEEIQSLLRHQPCGHAEHRNTRVRREPKSCLERCLALLLTLEILRGEAGSDLGVTRGIPDLVVDAIGDAEQPVPQRAERIAESEAAVR